MAQLASKAERSKGDVVFMSFRSSTRAARRAESYPPALAELVSDPAK
jgi:hypothetical protein